LGVGLAVPRSATLSAVGLVIEDNHSFVNFLF